MCLVHGSHSTLIPTVWRFPSASTGRHSTCHGFGTMITKATTNTKKHSAFFSS